MRAAIVFLALTALAAQSLAADPGELFSEGYRHLTGQGVPRDATWAAKLFLEAAQAGEPQAQYQLGVMHMEGLGVPKDMVWAYFWLNRSCMSQALPEAVRREGLARLKAVKHELSPDQKRRLGLGEGN